MALSEIDAGGRPAWNSAFCVLPSADWNLGRPEQVGISDWLSPDPLGGDLPDFAGIFDTNPQSLNRYTYALNNPTTFTDPRVAHTLSCMYAPALGVATEYFADRRHAKRCRRHPRGKRATASSSTTPKRRTSRIAAGSSKLVPPNANIPAAEWYVADLVMEITVLGVSRNVVHRNLTLIRAGSPEEAYEKALHFGHGAQTSYDNPQGKLVTIKFRGVARMDAVLEDLYDGGELIFEERVGVPPGEIARMIPSKSHLGAFRQPTPGTEHDPDYRSGAVMRMAVEHVSSGRQRRSGQSSPKQQASG